MSRDGTKTGGRLPGTPNKATAATRARIETEADPIGFLTRIQKGEGIESAAMKDQPGLEPVLVYPTLDQRLAAAKTLADKLVPNAKSSPIRVELPEKMETASDTKAALDSVLRAIAAGELAPDEGATITDIIGERYRTIEMANLQAELAELRSLVASKGKKAR